MRTVTLSPFAATKSLRILISHTAGSRETTTPAPEAMSASNETSKSSFSQTLSSETPFLKIKLYVVVVVSVCVLLVSLLVCVCILRRRTSRKRKMRVKHSSGLIPVVSKEIVEIKAVGGTDNLGKVEGKIEFGDLLKEEEIEDIKGIEEEEVKNKSGESDDRGSGSSNVSMADAQNIAWGRWYSLKELEIATRGFADANVIGEGGYGVVYKGFLQGGLVVAVKKLLNNK